jgi:hypothetical protein
MPMPLQCAIFSHMFLFYAHSLHFPSFISPPPPTDSAWSVLKISFKN